MDNFRELKIVKALIDAKENLKSDIVLNMEMLEENKGLKKRTFKEEEGIIKRNAKGNSFLKRKIKGICTN